jgi:hypothetical protein
MGEFEVFTVRKTKLRQRYLCTICLTRITGHQFPGAHNHVNELPRSKLQGINSLQP